MVESFNFVIFWGFQLFLRNLSSFWCFKNGGLNEIINFLRNYYCVNKEKTSLKSITQLLEINSGTLFVSVESGFSLDSSGFSVQLSSFGFYILYWKKLLSSWMCNRIVLNSFTIFSIHWIPQIFLFCIFVWCACDRAT